QGEKPASKPLPVAAVPLNQKGVKQAPAPKEGPDPNVPYFVNFADGKKNPTIPPNTWGPVFSNHNLYNAACGYRHGDVMAVRDTTGHPVAHRPRCSSPAVRGPGGVGRHAGAGVRRGPAPRRAAAAQPG